MPTKSEEPITIVVSSAELALLKKLDFPCSQEVLATASPGLEGIALHGSRADLASLAGWVAGEANHARRGPAPRQPLGAARGRPHHPSLKSVQRMLEAGRDRSEPRRPDAVERCTAPGQPSHALPLDHHPARVVAPRSRERLER